MRSPALGSQTVLPRPLPSVTDPSTTTDHTDSHGSVISVSVLSVQFCFLRVSGPAQADSHKEVREATKTISVRPHSRQAGFLCILVPFRGHNPVRQRPGAPSSLWANPPIGGHHFSARSFLTRRRGARGDRRMASAPRTPRLRVRPCLEVPRGGSKPASPVRLRGRDRSGPNLRALLRLSVRSVTPSASDDPTAGAHSDGQAIRVHRRSSAVPTPGEWRHRFTPVDADPDAETVRRDHR